MVEVLLSGIVLGLVPVTILGFLLRHIYNTAVETNLEFNPFKSFTKTKKILKKYKLLLLNNFFF